MSAVAQTPQVRWRHVKNRLETRRVLRTEPIHNGMTGAKWQDNQLTRIEVEAIASIEDQHAPPSRPTPRAVNRGPTSPPLWKLGLDTSFSLVAAGRGRWALLQDLFQQPEVATGC